MHALSRSGQRGKAITCSQVADATVIVIDPATTGGKDLIAGWISEHDKVVLDLSWISRSFKREKAYLADENWGGFRILDSEGTVPK